MIKPRMNDGILEVRAEDVHGHRTGEQIVDVRRPEEFNGELGHIKGAQLITLGPDLESFFKTLEKDQTVIFVCRSGARSGQATAFAHQLGFTNVMNMQGGMLTWNALKLPVERQ